MSGVALPHLVGERRLEADEGRLGALLRLRRDLAVAFEDATDRGHGGDIAAALLEVVATMSRDIQPSGRPLCGETQHYLGLHLVGQGFLALGRFIRRTKALDYARLAGASPGRSERCPGGSFHPPMATSGARHPVSLTMCFGSNKRKLHYSIVLGEKPLSTAFSRTVHRREVRRRFTPAARRSGARYNGVLWNTAAAVFSCSISSMLRRTTSTLDPAKCRSSGRTRPSWIAAPTLRRHRQAA